MEAEIKNILNEVLPKDTFIIVQEYKGFFKDNFLKIAFAVSEKTINDVNGQYVQLVSLSLNLNTLELIPQMYGGSGGNRIYRNINKNEPKEKYLAMMGIKIPFRKPKPIKEKILITIRKFAENWVNAIKENKEVLRYQNIVDYDKFLNS